MYNEKKHINGLPRETKQFTKTRYNNCYTYAINQPNSPFTERPYSDYNECQIGNLGGHGKKYKRNCFGYTDWNKKNIVRAVEEDLIKIGLKMTRTTLKMFIQNEKAWKVALCLEKYSSGTTGDYHWYRQNISGTWSHKKGMGKVYFKDDKGKRIYNPEKCDRGGYNKFVGFFMIEPIN